MITSGEQSEPWVQLFKKMVNYELSLTAPF